MDAAAFRRHGHELVEWIADYLEHSDRYPVLSRVAPGAIRSALPLEAPEDPEPFDAITVHAAGVAVYHLGNNGTARELLKAWAVTNS